MKILVTGGAGFIGSHVVDQFITLGHEVVVIDDLSTGKKKNLNSQARFYQQDICGQEIEELFQHEKFDVVCHHAAQISVRNSVMDPLHDAKNNILGLLNILEASRKNAIKKIIFASSGGAIYGEAREVPTPESYHPLRPISPYGVAKLSSEYYLWYYFEAYGFPFIALRYANVYGPRQDPHGEAGVVAIFAKKMLVNESPLINGDGKQIRDFVYVGDIARANLLAIDSSSVGVINIGTGVGTTIQEIFQTLKKYTGASIEEVYGPAKLGEQRQSVLSTSKAKQILGWESQVTLSQGLERTVKFFRG